MSICHLCGGGGTCPFCGGSGVETNTAFVHAASFVGRLVDRYPERDEGAWKTYQESRDIEDLADMLGLDGHERIMLYLAMGRVPISVREQARAYLVSGPELRPGA